MGSLISPCITAEHGLGSRLDSQSISSQFNRNIYNCVTLEMENKVGESFVETKNCFFKLSFYPHRIPETCRWLIEKDEVKMLDLNATLRRRAENRLICCVETFPTGHHHSPPSITLTIILTTILIILFIFAIITCVRRRKETDQIEDSDSVINLRISATLARLSRSYVVERQENEEEPPDYDTAMEIVTKEDEDLPSYCQAVTM